MHNRQQRLKEDARSTSARVYVKPVGIFWHKTTQLKETRQRNLSVTETMRESRLFSCSGVCLGYVSGRVFAAPEPDGNSAAVFFTSKPPRLEDAEKTPGVNFWNFWTHSNSTLRQYIEKLAGQVLPLTL